jgi:HSP20 family protein
MFRSLVPTLGPRFSDALFDRWLDEAFHVGTTPARRLDLRESDEQYVVRCEVPGLEPGELDLELQGDVLTIRTERRSEAGHERSSRSVRLELPVDAEKVQAELKHGVLTVTLPKHESARPRRIAIRTGAPSTPAPQQQQLEDRGPASAGTPAADSTPASA